MSYFFRIDFYFCRKDLDVFDLINANLLTDYIKTCHNLSLLHILSGNITVLMNCAVLNSKHIIMLFTVLK